MLRGIGFMIFVLVFGGGFPLQPGYAEEAEDKAGNVILVRHQTYCSSDQPGVSIAELQWPIAPQGLAAPDVKAAVDRQLLEVTVYKDGFDRGLYKRIQPGF